MTGPGATPGLAPPTEAAGLFHEEALQGHRSGGPRGSDPLQVSAGWTEWSYWLLFGFFAGGLALAFLARVNEYAAGPAIVRVEGRVDVAAHRAGTVLQVEVDPGQRVAAGDPLARLDDAEEAGALESHAAEFEWQLVKLLRDPGDGAARQALTALQAQKQLAERRLAERLVRAPCAGYVSDLRIRPGQRLEAGDAVLSIVPDEARFHLLAVLPGHYRPMLKPGSPLRLEMSGYRYAYTSMQIDAVGDEVVGPAEVKRFLGPGVADSVAISGPAVLVRTALPARSFVSEGKPYAYHDGMHGRAQVPVRSERAITLLFPWLKRLWEARP